jgi:hypothetical protein
MRYLTTQSRQASDYEWYTGDMNPLQKPWWDQEVIMFKDPNRSSIEPTSGSGSTNDGTSGTSSGSDSGSGPANQELRSQGSPPADGEMEGHQAPRYTTSARTSSGKVDVIITTGTVTFGHSVDARVSVDMLQRIAGNEAKITLNGYWVPIVIQGEGYIGRLCPHDQIPMYPGTEEDIRKINEPRTSASPGPMLTRKPSALGSTSPNFLALQVT